MCVDLIKAKIGMEAKPFTLRLEQTTREVSRTTRNKAR